MYLCVIRSVIYFITFLYNIVGLKVTEKKKMEELKYIAS